MTETTIPGPNADAVGRIVAKVATLTRTQITALAEAGFKSSLGSPMPGPYDNDLDNLRTEPTDTDNAHKAAQDAALAEGWMAGWDSVYMDVSRAVHRAVWTESRDGFSDAHIEWAVITAGNAADATMVKHLITEAQFELLTRPWQQVLASLTEH